MNSFASRLLAWTFIAALMTSCAHQTYGDMKDPVAGEVLGKVIHTRDADELRFVVLKQLTDRYADANGITVTQGEKDAYVRNMRNRLQKDREQNATRRDRLTRRLAAGELPEVERKALASELDTVNRTIEALGPPQSAAADPDEMKEREQIADAFIRQWKINRALYQQYGGRIIFQQGGPEPLDAYRWFLEERQARGDFRILNKDIELAFWRYYVTESIHSFYPRGSKEEAQVFAMPPWQSE